MKVLFCLPDRAGCGHYRCIYPGRASGVDSYLTDWTDVTIRRSPTGHEQVVEVADPEVDVVVMQRPLRRLNVEMIEPIQRHGVAVVVDVDDDFRCVDPQHFAYAKFQPKTSPESNYEHLSRACQLADLVTVTTPALAARYGKHGRVAILPNCVPRSMFGTLPAKRDQRTVGWGGYVETHPYDLQATRGGVGIACRDTGARFRCVGTGRNVARNLELGEVPFEADQRASDEDEEVGFRQYPYSIAEFTVGIAPLADSRFNAAKSALKGLEMAAVGVPFVASPTDDYVRLAEEGIGALAKWRSRDWARQVKWLLSEAGEEIAAQGREAVKSGHTYEGQAWRWLEAWDTAVASRRSLTHSPAF